MSLTKFFTSAGGTALLAGVLLIVLLAEYRRRKQMEQHMKEEMQKYRQESAHNAEIYERMFPKALMELFGIRQVSDISTNLSRTFKASVLSVNTLDYEAAMHTQDSGEMFRRMNDIFAEIIPKIVERGGIIDKFNKAGVSGLYLESEEQALQSAVSMCEAAEADREGEEWKDLSIGLDHGEVMIGIVGHEERISPVAMSECISISSFLESKTQKYGARILASGRFTERIGGFEKNYNSRFLGYFYDSSRESLIKVYDIYDGDDAGRKSGKRRTRMMFEQGADCFIHGQYAEARLYFVEVLKADRFDLAAREYLYLCDRYCAEPQAGGEIYLEKF